MKTVVSPNKPDSALDGRPVLRRPNRSMNTAVPRIDGTVCWQQHQHVFNAIAGSNGGDDRMAALQLFSHLEGEALYVALLMPEDQRDSPEGLSKALSEYYNSPVRLAIFRRKFDNVSRRDVEDPASFTTELEILAVRGFGEVGKAQMVRMVRDRFILG